APPISKRIVFHIGGYDPITPPEGAHLRFLRELRRFEGTWSVTASVATPNVSADEMKWNAATSGPNLCVETDYRLVRWDDAIRPFGRPPRWRRLPLGILAFFDFVSAGALWGYFRTNWHYAVFFLSPFITFGILSVVSIIAGTFVCRQTASASAGILGGLVAFGALLAGPWRWLHLAPLFDDWIFSRT